MLQRVQVLQLEQPQLEQQPRAHWTTVQHQLQVRVQEHPQEQQPRERQPQEWDQQQEQQQELDQQELRLQQQHPQGPQE